MAEDYDIGVAIKNIEDELIASMIRNLDHHRAEETKEGYNWSQWQVEQLAALEEYKKRNAKRYKDPFKDINNSIGPLIALQRQAGNASQEIAILNAIRKGAKISKPERNAEMLGKFFKANDSKINALIKATTDDMKKAETAILRKADDDYRKVIFESQLYANTGASYAQAVDMATKAFLKVGIQCIEYSNGARHTLSDYADMAIKTASKRAYLTGEGEKNAEWGISTVIINKRGGNPCPKCLPFVGKVLIDDVWSGGSSEDGPYPLMSSAMAAGLYHPRCKDIHTTYFPGISAPPDDTYTIEELNDIEEQSKEEAKEQYLQRQLEGNERLSKYSLDPDNKKKYQARADEWMDRYNTMAAKSDQIQWPVKGQKISSSEYKGIMSYARAHNIELSGFKQFDGQLQTVVDLIDDAEQVTKKYPGITSGKKRLTIMLEEMMRPEDFAITRGHIISINANAYRNVDMLAKEYSKLVDEGWFVKGTDYHSIIKHEIGHVISNTYGIDGLEIAMKITGINRKDTMEFVKECLSEYAGEFKDGSEIISEVFSEVYNLKNPREFSLQFIDECARIKEKGM